MRYKKQRYNSCLAYALWQIGVVNEKIVRDYERNKTYNTRELQDKWIKKYVPQLKWFGEYSLVTASSLDPLEGRGVVVLSEKELHVYHAISYENGVVLDADQPEERMSLEEYLRRFPHRELLKILPIVEQDHSWRRKWLSLREGIIRRLRRNFEELNLL